MSNDGDVYGRLFKLWAMICKMVMDGVRDPERVANILQTIVSATRRLTRTLFGGVALAATTGREVETAKSVFGYCDPAFTRGGVDDPTAERAMDVEEMVEDGTYRQVFDGMGRALDSLCLTRSQITAFCRDHRGKLRDEGYGTFFLYKEGGAFFVAFVNVVVIGRLYVFVHSLGLGHAWCTEYRHRVVLPQQ